jgi:competence protein ComEC
MAQKVLQLNLPYCKNENLNVQSWVYTKPKNTNESSKVFIDQKILIPADSPVKQEKLWANEMTGLINVEIIILGHHGSRTSTSTELLLKLKNIKMAMVSARYAKYKHPHLQVLNNLMEFGIPVLKTEDWGNIWFTSN